MGGQNFHAVSELSYMHLKNGHKSDLDELEPLWSKIPVTFPTTKSDIPVMPKACFGHSTVVYKDKIITFGGSF